MDGGKWGWLEEELGEDSGEEGEEELFSFGNHSAPGWSNGVMGALGGQFWEREVIMAGKVLMPEQQARVREMAAERVGGRPRYTQAELADLFGVGETTIHRIVKATGAYRKVGQAISNEYIEELAVKAKESEARMMAKLRADGLLVKEGPRAVPVAYPDEESGNGD